MSGWAPSPTGRRADRAGSAYSELERRRYSGGSVERGDGVQGGSAREGSRGRCAMGYRPGDAFAVEMSPFLKGASARDLGIGGEDDIGYVQCPDSGELCTAVV